MTATEAAETSLSAAAAASFACSTGFDLINHAIRMNPGSGTPIAPPVIDDESSKAVHHRNNELLLNARLLERQRGIVPMSALADSTVGPLDLVRIKSAHSHASEIAANAAAQQHINLVRQQLCGGGIATFLQRRHRQPSGPSLLDIPVPATGIQLHPHLRAASYLGGAAAGTEAPGITSVPTKASGFVHPPPTATNSRHQQHSQDERNARQLNPNAFQFPWKLHDMLDRSSSEGNEEVVSWVDNGEAFRVNLPYVFVERIMPRFFKQTKYKSFQRQLNLYGFTRLHNGPKKGGYKHKYFRRGQRTMCQLITRCPIRDSSSAATAITATEDTMADRLSMSASENGNRMVVDEDNKIKNGNIETITPPPATLSPSVSTVSISSKPSLPSLKKEQQHQAAIVLAAHQQQRIDVLSNNFQMLGKAHQEQQLKFQQFKAHRLKQLQLLQLHQQQQRGSPLTSSYVPEMPLVGTGHSAYPSMASWHNSVPRTSSISHVPERTNGNVTADSPLSVLNASNSFSLESEANASPLELGLGFQFPWKLYEMLERADEGNFNHLVSWMPGDFCFKIHNADIFAELVMPCFFKQTKYKSFQRQLNLYGFIRVDKGPNKGGYRHSRFIKGRKDLLALINRVKVKGNEHLRLDRSNSNAVIIDTESADNSNRSNAKETKSTSVVAQTSVVANPETISGIAVILEAIKAKQRTKSTVTEAAAAALTNISSNVVHEVVDNNSDSNNSTISSTIDVRMKELSRTNNGCEFSWRQHPSESFSDWTIEVIEEDIIGPHDGECAVYHVHRRVLAIGPKKSDYFANIFKSNGSTHRTKLRLTKRQAAVFPLALDYIYAHIEFDFNVEMAHALYNLGERLENTSIVQTVTEYYFKCCMTKDNVVEFIRLGRTFQNKTLLDAAVLKCSQEIWFMDVEIAAKIDPGLLFLILANATTVAKNRDLSEYDSLKLSQIVAISVSNATRITLTLEIFRSLTDNLILPSVEPIAAIKILATENSLLSGGSHRGPHLAGDSSLHERCVSSIHRNWEAVRKRLAKSTELTNTMRSISFMVMYDLLMKTTTSPGSG